MGARNPGTLIFDCYLLSIVPSEWNGSGVQATPEQQAEVPPVIGTTTESGSPEVLEVVNDPDTTQEELDALNLTDEQIQAANYTSPDFEPIIIEVEPVLVEGTFIEEALNGEDQDPVIAGGIVTDSTTPNTEEGQDTFDDAIASVTTTTTNPDTGETTYTYDPAGTIGIPEAGSRQLAPQGWDCSGLTGYNCCLMIKALVPDADIYGNAIQCHLNYDESSMKKKFFDSRGKKVFIFANGNNIVRKTPKLVGNWPGKPQNRRMVG